MAADEDEDAMRMVKSIESDVSKIMIERNDSLYHNSPLNPPTILTKPLYHGQ